MSAINRPRKRRKQFTLVGNKRPLRRSRGRIKDQLSRSSLDIAGRTVALKFFMHKAKHPGVTPYEKLTPLQKRMQSGFEFPGYGV